jgi:prefoldin subunit 5
VKEEKELLQSAIENLNEEIKDLAYKLEGALDIACNFGVCAYDPEADDLQDKIREVQEKKELLERIKRNIDSCLLK